MSPVATHRRAAGARRIVLGLAAVALIAAWSGAASAQEDLFAEEPSSSEANWGVLGDFVFRRDQVNGLPNREAVDRFRLRGRFGAHYNTGAWEFGAALEAAQGSDANKDNRRNNDNEKSDGVNLDRAYARWQAGENTQLTLGKNELPFGLTPLVWDDDLRPVGAAVNHDIALGDFDRLSLGAGYFAGDHLYGDDSRLGAAQVGWHLREGADSSGSVLLTFLTFDHIDKLARNGLGRTNRIAAGRFLEDYDLLDLQFAWRHALGEAPLELRLDLVRNFGADDERDGARFSAIFGSSRVAGGWEAAVSYERIQRDAVLAAFNSDDWWFHSAMRGVMPWVAYGIDDTWSVQLAGFFERRDGQPDNLERLLLDVRANW